MSQPIHLVSEDASVFAAAEDAGARGQFLICDGHQTQISPIVPPGWFRLGITIKPTTEQKRCAA